MRRAHSLPIALLAATTLAGAALAQTPQPAARQDLRQLSWPGRSAGAVPSAGPVATRPDLRRSNLVIPHGGFHASAPTAAAPDAPVARRTLTPANAWLQPVSPAPPPPPPAMPEAVRAEAATPSAPPPVARPAATPEYLPDQGGRGQRAPADIVYPPALDAPPAPAASQDQPADPMAPRRDAPIFRLQQAAPPPDQAAEAPPAAQAEPQAAPTRPRYVAEVTNTGERPPQQGARYYSVHRQNGRQPDSLTMPEPTFVDALAVTMTQTPASQDLAAPDQGPTLIRDAQGRTRPVPAASDGDHQ